MGGEAVLLVLAVLSSLLAGALAGCSKRGRAVGRNAFDPKFEETAKEVAALRPCSPVNAWELGNLIEGDIMPVNYDGRLVTSNETRKWQNKTLPYLIEQIDFTKEQISEIVNAIREVNNLSCLTLREAVSADKDFVRIKGKQQGCWAHTGRIQGEQTINLQPPTCLLKGNIYHQLLHAIGFWHMHNSLNRDDYIRINWDNVKKGKEDYFKKHQACEELTDFGLRYDYESIMHASRKAHSKNGLDTIDTLDPSVTIGQRNKPSRFDVSKLKLMYKCEQKSRRPKP